jgi:AcrR family transcriptional regulator
VTAQDGRPNQRRRTRKALLQAATRLLQQGRTPSLEEVAEEALVSRATAYRYFQSVDRLLLEAPLDVSFPATGDLFADGAPADPVLRLDRVEAALDDMMTRHEVPLRLMLARSLECIAKGEDGALPHRQNRRSDLIEAALAPARASFGREDYKRLKAALALVIGTEAMVVFRDVLQMSDAEAKTVKRWAIRALVAAATK